MEHLKTLVVPGRDEKQSKWIELIGQQRQKKKGMNFFHRNMRKHEKMNFFVKKRLVTNKTLKNRFITKGNILEGTDVNEKPLCI